MRKKKTSNFFLLRTVLALSLCVGMSAPVSARDMKSYPRVKLQSLDKATARTMTFEARVGSTLKFGPLYIKVQSCQKTPPIEQPEAAAFMQVWEVDTEKKAQWVFSGWMFASSPALSPMDHPIYDVWLLDCLDDTTGEDSATSEEGVATDEHAAPGDLLEQQQIQPQ